LKAPARVSTLDLLVSKVCFQIQLAPLHNGGIPTICEAFFPKETETPPLSALPSAPAGLLPLQSSTSNASFPDGPESIAEGDEDGGSISGGDTPRTPTRVAGTPPPETSAEDRAALVSALESFQQVGGAVQGTAVQAEFSLPIAFESAMVATQEL
jgi:hypothetical protein